MTNATPAPIEADALSHEELIAMAREADPFGDDGRLVSLAMLTPGTLERFAALVAAAEREACAKACEAIEAERWSAYKTGTPEQGRGHPFVEGQSDGAEQCAAAIRARSEK